MYGVKQRREEKNQEWKNLEVISSNWISGSPSHSPSTERHEGQILGQPREVGEFAE